MSSRRQVLAQSTLCNCAGKAPGGCPGWGVPGAWGSAEGVWGPPWSSSRCGTRLWCRAPCHRPLCWGAAGGLRRTPARSLHHRCCRRSGPVGSSGRARTAQSTEGTRGIQAWASPAASPASSSGASEPGCAFDAWLSGYRASWAEEQAEYGALGPQAPVPSLRRLTDGGST